MAREYQGHKNRNHWNVALWLNNDYDNYHLMLHNLKLYGRKNAPGLVKIALANRGMVKTPDGAPYSVSAIRAAMRGLDA